MKAADEGQQQIISPPQREYYFLKNNALLSLFVGVFFMMDVIYKWLSPIIKLNSLANGFFLILGAVVFIGYFVMFFKTLSAMGGISKATFWYGNFKDEYFSYINNKGYKWSFYVINFILISVYLMDDLSLILFENITISEYSKFIVGFVFIGYALPVLYLLRGESEDE